MARLPHKPPFWPGVIAPCLVPLLLAAAIAMAGVTNKSQSADFQTLSTAAVAGQPTAQFKLGDYYFAHGDFTNAVVWYHRAAEQGNIDAQISLSSCYAHGRGVARDVSQAFHWSRRAALHIGRSTEAITNATSSAERTGPSSAAESAPVIQARPVAAGPVGGAAARLVTTTGTTGTIRTIATTATAPAADEPPAAVPAPEANPGRFPLTRRIQRLEAPTPTLDLSK